VQRLCEHLRLVYELELNLGNSVQRVDEPAGTRCPLAVIFAAPLHFAEAEAKSLIKPPLRRWVNVDPHYPREAGLVCEESQHVLAGPLP